MTSRVSYAPQDFQRMCEQAERDHENRKVVILLQRVKRQIALRDAGTGANVESPKPPVTVIAENETLRMPARVLPLER
jgi:hypothetical protein